MGIICFVKINKHVLRSLISLEFIMLNVFWLMLMSLSFIGGEAYFSLFFLTLSACEGALGLALVVLISRTHGRDDFKIINVLRC